MTDVAALYEQVRISLEPDGSLRDLTINDVSVGEWQALLGLIARAWPHKFYLEAVAQPLPTNIEKIYELAAQATTLLQIEVDEITVHLHFFALDRVEFNVDPRQIQDLNRFTSLVCFIEAVGVLFSRDLHLIYENSPEHPIMKFDFRKSCCERMTPIQA